MRDINALIHSMDAETLRARLDALATTFSGHEGSGLGVAEIEDLFEWMLGSAHLGDQDSVLEIYHVLDAAILDYMERHPGSGESYDFLYEWSMVSIRYLQEQRDTFVYLPIYQDLFAALVNAPPTHAHLAVLTRLHLMRHFQHWQSNGGKTNKLSAEELAWIQDMQAGYEEASDTALEQAEARGDVEVVVRLYRDAAQFYFFTQQPNDGIACLKSAVEEMPKVPGYIPADSAHVLMEIGQVFLAFKKPAIALKYFTQAKDIYDASGESLEMEAHRAEGWIDECKKRGA
jgi:tetratricopeptide (TPR) repeat protein